MKSACTVIQKAGLIVVASGRFRERLRKNCRATASRAAYPAYPNPIEGEAIRPKVLELFGTGSLT